MFFLYFLNKYSLDEQETPLKKNKVNYLLGL